MLEINNDDFLLVASDVHDCDDIFEELEKTACQSRCLAFIYAGDLNIDNFFIAHHIMCRNYVFLPVQGNCDNLWAWTDVRQSLPPYRTCTYKGLRIFISHGHLYASPSMAGLEDASFDLVVTGHTHIPSITEEIVSGKEVVYLNPGSAARPRGYSRASFAIIRFKENGKVSLEIRALKDNGLLSEKTITLKQAPAGNN